LGRANPARFASASLEPPAAADGAGDAAEGYTQGHIRWPLQTKQSLNLFGNLV
jgi:hypothetical protein